MGGLGITRFGNLIWGVGIVVALILSPIVSATEGQFTAPVPGRTLYMDPLLSAKTAKLLRADLLVISQLPVQAQAGSWFEQLFGGRGAQAATQFLDDRVNFFVSDRVPVEDRLLLDDRVRANRIALNVGTSLWMFALRDANAGIGMRLGRYRVNPNSPRVGLVQISESYNRNLSLVSRLDTLLHEARHSDCTGGLPAGDLARLRAALVPNGVACGHFHTICPTGHPFAGEPACDSHAWGAYSTGGVYSASVARGCKGCKEKMIQEATVTSLDSFSRLVRDNGGSFAEEMLNGAWGKPDPSSSLGSAPSGDRPDFEVIK